MGLTRIGRILHWRIAVTVGVLLDTLAFDPIIFHYEKHSLGPGN